MFILKKNSTRLRSECRSEHTQEACGSLRNDGQQPAEGTAAAGREAASEGRFDLHIARHHVGGAIRQSACDKGYCSWAEREWEGGGS